MLHWCRLLLAGLALAGSAGLLRGAAPVGTQFYRGFTIDASRLRNPPNLELIIAATKEQIDIVHAVGLPAEILTFLEGVSFRLMPAGSFASPTPGLYGGRGDRSVQVSAAIVTTGHKPVLLHELMHAYHDQRIERGYGNRAILGYYERAKSIPAFAAKSHMMQNEKEFFASAATTYLFGVTAQEPFTREKLRQQQPELHEFLHKLFGPSTGDYAGSLTRN